MTTRPRRSTPRASTSLLRRSCTDLLDLARNPTRFRWPIPRFVVRPSASTSTLSLFVHHRTSLTPPFGCTIPKELKGSCYICRTGDDPTPGPPLSRWAYLTVGVRAVPSHQQRLFLNGSPQENDQWNETAARADTDMDNFVRGTPDSSLKDRLRGHA